MRAFSCSGVDMRILLVNPNTNSNITKTMADRAQLHAQDLFGDTVCIIGETVIDGEKLITDEPALKRSSESVLNFLSQRDLCNVPEYCGVIISAFGDPAVNLLSLPVPVVGIGESSIKEAKSLRRPFCIVTTTPLLEASMKKQVADQDAVNLFVGIIISSGDPREVMQSPERLEASLAECCKDAIEKHHAEVIIIGGGPLASASNALQQRFPQCVILDPIRCAMKALAQKLDVQAAQSRDSSTR
jgi:allantoin racemase